VPEKMNGKFGKCQPIKLNVLTEVK